MTPEELDDHIDKWHNSDSNKPLHEFLGMTREQYSLWISGQGKLKAGPGMTRDEFAKKYGRVEP